MKFRTHIVAVISLALTFSCSNCTQPSGENYRYIHNNDGTDLLGNRWFGCRPITVADLDSCIDLVADSPITTYMMCTGSDFFYYESRFGRVMGDDLDGKIPVGEDTAQFNVCHEYYLNYMRLKEEGVDFLGHIFERVRSKGKEAFITYRMNDLHFSSVEDVCPLARLDLMAEHPEWLINDNNEQGWHSSGGLNFALDEVRGRKLAIITEQLEKYGRLIDGYELDFLRFPVYFKPGEGPSHTDCMTDMVKKTRVKLDSMSMVTGRKLMLAVRVAPSIEENLKLGIDIEEWLRLGLVDFVTIASFWRGDPALPVENFRKELGDVLDVPLYANVEDGGYSKRVSWTHGDLRGICSHNLGQGADGVCLFNYYFGDWFKKLQSGGVTEKGGQVIRAICPEMLGELGTLETLEGRNKIYLLSDGGADYLLSHATPLPLTLVDGENKEAEIFVGDSMKKKRPEEVILFVRAQGNIAAKFNGKALETENASYPALYDEELNLDEGDAVHAYIVKSSLLRHGLNAISFSTLSGTGTVKRIELALKYGSAEECGYF